MNCIPLMTPLNDPLNDHGRLVVGMTLMTAVSSWVMGAGCEGAGEAEDRRWIAMLIVVSPLRA
jgi:hypothetical protein